LQLLLRMGVDARRCACRTSSAHELYCLASIHVQDIVLYERMSWEAAFTLAGQHSADVSLLAFSKNGGSCARGETAGLCLQCLSHDNKTWEWLPYIFCRVQKAAVAGWPAFAASILGLPS
jgi:hypothetical protein